MKYLVFVAFFGIFYNSSGQIKGKYKPPVKLTAELHGNKNVAIDYGDVTGDGVKDFVVANFAGDFFCQ